jgi:hypothetical protein
MELLTTKVYGENTNVGFRPKKVYDENTKIREPDSARIKYTAKIRVSVSSRIQNMAKIRKPDSSRIKYTTKIRALDSDRIKYTTKIRASDSRRIKTRVRTGPPPNNHPGKQTYLSAGQRSNRRRETCATPSLTQNSHSRFNPTASSDLPNALNASSMIWPT